MLPNNLCWRPLAVTPRRMENQKITSNGNAPLLRELLKSELISRCKKNPQYSLRAFAKSLGVSPSILSRVISGDRDPSREFISKAAASLRLPIEKLRKVYEVQPSDTEARLSDFKDLMQDQFEVLSDWVHYAIFELMETKDFEPTPKWMSARLGISIFEVERALERLEALKLIERGTNGYKKLVPDIATTSHEFSTLALRNLQRQFLEMAAKSMDEVPFEQRSQTTMVMAIDPRRIKEAKEKIKKFRFEMLGYLQESQNMSEVYNLTIGFYPVTKVRSKKQGVKK